MPPRFPLGQVTVKEEAALALAGQDAAQEQPATDRRANP
jgi:hypothetical protein